MGRRAERRKAFLAAHPDCCFCGGKEPATTIDHIPARALFLGRRWPDGYEFPACESCNSGASDDELLMSVAMRILAFKDPSPEEERELEHALKGVEFRKPGLISKFREFSRVDTKRYFRDRGSSPTRPDGGELYLMSIPDEFGEAYVRYGTKLAKALHYMHTRTIAPEEAAIKVRALTNADMVQLPFPPEVLSILTNGALVRNGKTSLSDQFRYRFAVTKDTLASAFWVEFGESAAMLLAVFPDGERYELTKAARLAEQNGELAVFNSLESQRNG